MRGSAARQNNRILTRKHSVQHHKQHKRQHQDPHRPQQERKRMSSSPLNIADFFACNLLPPPSPTAARVVAAPYVLAMVSKVTNALTSWLTCELWSQQYILVTMTYVLITNEGSCHFAPTEGYLLGRPHVQTLMASVCLRGAVLRCSQCWKWPPCSGRLDFRQESMQRVKGKLDEASDSHCQESHFGSARGVTDLDPEPPSVGKAMKANAMEGWGDEGARVDENGKRLQKNILVDLKVPAGWTEEACKGTTCFYWSAKGNESWRWACSMCGHSFNGINLANRCMSGKTVWVCGGFCWANT